MAIRVNEDATRPLVPHSGTRELMRQAIPFVLVSILGLVIRCAYFWQTASIPFLHNLVGDAAGYWEWGAHIAAGDWMGKESFYQAPLYPYFLSVIFRILGNSILVVRVMQALTASVALAALGWGTSRLFGRAAGLIAAAMFALYAPSIYFDGIVQKESVAASLVCILFATMIWHSNSSRILTCLVIGVLLGLLALIRENTQLWMPIILFWIWRAERTGSRGGAKMVACVFGCALVLGPVAIRNKHICGEWSISTFQAGPNFYIGNSTEADGRYRPLVRGHETPAFERRDATALAETAVGRSLSSREVSRFWFRRGLTDIANDPLRWAKLMALKLAMVFNDYEVTDGESQYVYADYSPVLRTLQSFSRFGLIFSLAMMGVWMTRSRWRELWIYHALLLSFALSVAVFYVLARYRFPMVPLLISFAAVGVLELGRRVLAGNWREAGAGLAFGVLAFCVTYLPVHDRGRLDALARMNLGVALAQSGDIPSAIVQFAKAVEGHPTSAEANMNLAQALAVSGRFADSIPHYLRAIKADPGLMGVEFNLAVALEQVGRIEDARAMYRQAVEKDANDIDAQAAVKRLEAGAR